MILVDATTRAETRLSAECDAWEVIIVRGGRVRRVTTHARYAGDTTTSYRMATGHADALNALMVRDRVEITKSALDKAFRMERYDQ